MIKSMNITNLPRQSGKTSNLIRVMIEEYSKYDSVFVITFNEQQRKYWQKQVNLFSNFNSNSIRDNVVVVSAPSIICQNPLFNIPLYFNGGKNIIKKDLVIIDEPFMIDDEIQTKIIEILECSISEYTVYGSGTKMEKPKRLFSDFC